MSSENATPATRLQPIVMPLEPFDDPSHAWNSAVYHSGKQCIGGEDALLPAMPRCDGKAGTAWSPHWCQPCNAKRIRRITKSLKKLCEPREA